MARQRRAHEEHLERIEPIGVVLLNNLSYLLEDLSETLLDISKLFEHRAEEMVDFMKSVKGGPEALGDHLPKELMQKVMGAAMEVGGTAMQLKSKVSRSDEEGGAEGDEEASSGPAGLKAIDPSKIRPGMLKQLGTMLREKTEHIQQAVADYEAELLQEHPPVPVEPPSASGEAADPAEAPAAAGETAADPGAPDS